MADTRDLRDPQKLGEALRTIREWNTELPLSQLVDQYRETLSKVPDYPQDESLATITARRYRAELEERAANGDKYAKSLLGGDSWDEPV